MVSHLGTNQIIDDCYDATNHQIRVAAQVTANISGAQDIVITHVDDSIKIGDGVDFLAVNADGSINVAVNNLPATQPVSIASMPSTPVTGTFYQATQPVSIASMPSTPVTGTFYQATQPVSGTVTATGPVTDTQLRASAITSIGIGTENGTTSGTQRAFVNNLFQQVLSTQDCVQTFAYADFGTATERVTSITYTSATVAGHTATKTFAYTSVGGVYRLDTITRSVS